MQTLLSLATDTQPTDSVANQSHSDMDGGWMISFVDILMLLLTLFVLLLAFHTVHSADDQVATTERTDNRVTENQTQPVAAPAPPLVAKRPTASSQAAERTDEVREASVRATETFLANAMGAQGLVQALDSTATAAKPKPLQAGTLYLSEATARNALLDALETRASVITEQKDVAAPPTPAFEVPAAVRERVEVASSADAVNLIIKDEVLFDLASADLKPQANGILDELATLLKTNDYTVSVEGHTDDKPIHTARYPSNWDLSVARATRVTRYLIEHGIARQRLRAVGYADTKPLDTAATPEAQARNRRVSLVVHLREPKAESLVQRISDPTDHDT